MFKKKFRLLWFQKFSKIRKNQKNKYMRKLKPSLNKQLESELFTLIIRNVKLINSITKDAQRYHKNTNKLIKKI